MFLLLTLIQVVFCEINPDIISGNSTIDIIILGPSFTTVNIIICLTLAVILWPFLKKLLEKFKKHAI